MTIILNKSIKADSMFIAEDYFPAIVNFSSEELNNHFMEFNYRDTDMLELSINPETHELKRLTLTLCNHYNIVDTPLNIPEYETGALLIDGPDSTECESFMVDVYTDGVKISMSSAPAQKYYRSGHLIFSIGDSDILTAVYIVGLTVEDIAHIKNELLQ